MPHRRGFLVAVASLAVPAAGCVSRPRGSRTVELQSVAVRNDDDQTHSLSIRVEDGGDSVFEERYEVAPDTVNEFAHEVTGPGEYTVEVSFGGTEYSRDLVAGSDGDESCVRVVWEIPSSGTLSSSLQSATDCSQD